MFVGEKAVQDTLQQGVLDILADDTLLPMMLSGLPETQRQEALTWFRENGPQNFTISQAFPRAAPLLPVIAVLPGGLTETDEFVGQVGAIRRNDDNTITELDSIYFSSSTRTLILSPNADATSWLAAFCVFTLARYRNALTEQGLYEQTIQASDLNSAEEFQPELIFSRAVTLTGKVEVSFPTRLAVPPAAVQVSATINAQTAEAVTYVRPVHDDFTRPDAQVLNDAVSGQPWVALAGVWGISANRGYVVTSEGNDRDTAVLDLGAPNVQISVVFAHVVNGARAAFRATDRDNFLCVEATATGYAVRRRQAGAWTTLVTYGVARTDGDDINVVLSGQAITTYLNGARLGVVNDGFNATATLCGIGVGAGAVAARFGSFDTT